MMGITAGSWGFRESLTLQGDSVYVDSIERLQIVFVSPTGNRIVKTLTALQDRDPVTKRWSWPCEAGDVDEAGIYRYQVVDITRGRNIASDVRTFSVCPRI